MARLTLLCLASLISLGLAGPLQSSRDRPSHSSHREPTNRSSSGRCDHKDNVFQPGQTYEYKYFGKAETGLGFANSKAVGLAVECDVKLSVPEPCQFRMKVAHCKVFERDASPQDREFSSSRHGSLEEEVRALEQHIDSPTKHGYEPSDKSDELTQAVTQHDIEAEISNGEVSKVIYHEDEDIWVVNFKKGILDALQIRTDVDTPRNVILVNGVHGLCPTKYSAHGTTESITEDKDLDSCIHATKKSWELSPLTPVWNMSLVSTVMSSRSLCSYKLRRSSHVETMACRETHRLLPLPWNLNVSAMSANVTQTLKFIRTSSTAQPMDRSMSKKVITSILYEHENSTDIDRDAAGTDNEADDILQDLVKQAIEGFDISSPAQFDDFVTELRQAGDLSSLVQQIKSFSEDEKEVAKYLTVQGLVQCNAPACLRALTTMIQSQELPAPVFEPVVMALALTKQQDPLFLAEITRMCEHKPSRTCALMVGAMTHKLVTDDREDDDSEDLFDDQESADAIKKAVKFLIDLIEESKCEPANILDKTDEDDDATKLIIALKALGNLGSVGQEVQQKFSGASSKRMEEKIVKCMTDKQVPANVTLAAIHAVRKFIPNQFISDRLLSVLADQSRPQEVRMAACMVSVRMAADKASVRNIVKVMEQEPSEQIKAFMVSHLKSVLKSEDPNYKETAELIEQVLQESGKSLPKTKARLPHSVHLELSKFFEVPFLDQDDNDFGAQVESSVIFTPKSYIPKALHLNVSGQAFSEYVNLLETGIEFRGVEDLVEKVLGPSGMLAKSKILRQVRESLIKVAQIAEDLSYKYLRMDSMKEYGRKAFSIVQTESFDAIVDRILSALQDVDTTELNKILSHARNFDMDQLMETIKKNIPQSAQMTKVVEKLKRINFREASEETLIEVLEAFGISEKKSRDVLLQVQEYGVNINEIIRWVKRTDLSAIQENLKNLRTGAIQDNFSSALMKVKQFFNWIAEKYNLPDMSALMDMVQQALKNPSEITRLKDTFMESRKNSLRGKFVKPSVRRSAFDEDDQEDDEQTDQDEDDESSLNQMPWGRNVKNIKHRKDTDDQDDDDSDDDDVEITAFIRIFGNELGFISWSDITKFWDTDKLMKKFDVKRNWRDIMDGFDIRPTVATKMEGIHHISTGLGLPLQITLNLTTIATVHIKMEPQGSSFRKSAIEFEPSGAMQLAGGMAIDLPTIHKIEAVSNTTVKSELELKVRVDLKEGAFEIHVEKPDEELDIFQIRHELKLVKDDEDYPPFDESKSNEVHKQKCLPEMVERVTGLKVCAELETSTLRGSKMLSHGPHELRVSVQESGSSGAEHYKFTGKHDKQSTKNRFELNFRAPGSQQRREARAIMFHDRQRNDIDMEFDVPEQNTPRMKIFMKNLGDSYEKYGAEVGFDIETTPRKHYNASVTVIGKLSGYGGSRYRDERISDVLQSGAFNYTVKGSVQTPVAWVNVSTTTAKFGHTLMMEHNLTYFISDEVRVPLLKKLRFPNAQERDGVSKFVLRHGVKAKIDQMAYDLQAFIKFMTFPLLSVPEPQIEHVTQLKVHRDYRHVGVHANTTWLNAQHELEFLNASITANNLNTIHRLSEPAIIKLNISRNDWYIGGKAQLRKEDSSELNLRGELTAFAMVPDCTSMFECAKKRLKSEAKAIAEIIKFKPTAMEMRPHSYHRVRPAGKLSHDESGTTGRPMKTTVVIEGRLRQKSGSPLGYDTFTSRRSLGAGHVWELKSTLDIRSNNGSPKQMQAVTEFGNDVAERDAIVNLFIIHNQTATNIPYGLDHFAQLLISRNEGLLISVNTSIDKSDDTLLGVGAILQINPQQKKAHIGANIDTPFVDASARASIKKPERGVVEVELLTKTESETGRTHLLTHEMQAVAKMGSGKLTTKLKFLHPKVETEFKSELDLYSDGSDADFDAGLEFDNEVDDDDNTTTNDQGDDDNDETTSSTRAKNRGGSSPFKSGNNKKRIGGRAKRSSWKSSSTSAESPSSRRVSKYDKLRSSGDQQTTDNDDDEYTTTESSSRRSWKSSSRDQDNTEDDEYTTTESSRRRHGSKSSDNEWDSTTPSPDDDENTQTSYNREGGFFGKSSRKNAQNKPGKHRSSSSRSTTESYGDDTTQDNDWSTANENDDDSSSTFRRSSLRNKSSRKSSKNTGSSWGSFFGTEDDDQTTTSQETSRVQSRRSPSNMRSNKFQKTDKSQSTWDTNGSDEDDQETGNWFSGKSSKSRWNSQRIRDNLKQIKPKIASSLKIRSLDRDLFPTVHIQGKATIRQVSLEVDIREVPRAIEEFISATKFELKGQIQDQKAILKLTVGQRGEVGVELHVRSDREATGKIYDRGLTSSGETVHAQITVSLPTDSTIAIKFKIDPESSSKITRHLKDTSRRAYDVTSRFAKDKSERGWKEARRMWSDEDHPVYKYTRSYYQGTMEDWKNDAVKHGKSWYESSKDYAGDMYSDDSLLGASLQDVVREINHQRKKWMEYVMDLIRDTPAGEWVDAFPSLDEFYSQVSEITSRHLGPQIRMIKSRQHCILMQSCDAMGALRAVQEVAIELTQTVDPTRARELAESAFKIVQDLLLQFVQTLQEKSRHNESIRSVIGTINLDELKETIRRAEPPNAETIMDAVRTAIVLIKDVTVKRFDALDEDRDGSVTVTIPHPFKWNSFKQMPKWTESQRQKTNEYFEKTKRAFKNLTDYKDVSRIKLPGRDQPINFRWSDMKKFPQKNMPSHIAMIFGDRHVMTFDGKVFALPETADQQCTYLLSRGTRSKKFSLVKDKSTVTLTLPEMVISINEQNEVRINNTHVPLPVESSSKKTKVRLIGDTVEVESDMGITMKVTGEKKIVLVEVSTALWGEVMGVLGTNDNEMSNDWDMPSSGRRAGNVEEFLNEYEVGKTPQCRLVKGQRSQQKQCAKSSKCAQLFSSSGSPLKECFQTVDPEEFKQACEAESNKCGRSEADETVCNIVAAYRKVCSEQNVETDAPEDCEACEGGRKENSEWNVRGNQRKVDAVVLVSEHRDFASVAAPEKIRSLMDSVIRKLRSTGGQDVRVALVGFSGAGVHKEGHTHTMDHEQFGSPDKLAQALRTLQFKGTEKTDALEAVEYVLDSHDFRPEATKIMLIFGAEESELISAHARIQSVQEKLTEQGVTLTVFSKYGSEDIKDRDHGVNYDGSIFSSKWSSSSSSSSSSTENQPNQHMSQAEMPRRKLSFLAKSSRGAVFQLDSLLNDRNKQSQIEERAASTVLDQVKREETMCKTCVCKETDLQQLISACRVSACA